MDRFIFETPLGGIFIIVLLILAAIAAWGAIRQQPVAYVETAPPASDQPRRGLFGRPQPLRAAPATAIVEAPLIPEPCRKEREENERLKRELEEADRKIANLSTLAPRTPEPTIRPESKASTAEQREFQKLALHEKVRRFRHANAGAADRIYNQIVTARTDGQARQDSRDDFELMINWFEKKSGQAVNADDLWNKLVILTKEKEQSRIANVTAAEKRTEAEQLNKAKRADDFRLMRERAPFFKGKLSIMLMRFRDDDATNQNALWSEAVKADPQLENVRDAFDVFSQYATKRGAPLPDEATLWQQMVEYFKVRDEVGIRKRILSNALRSFKDETDAPEVLRMALRDEERFKQLTGQLTPGPTTPADVDALDRFIKHLTTVEPELIFEDKSEILPLLRQANERLDEEEDSAADNEE